MGNTVNTAANIHNLVTPKQLRLIWVLCARIPVHPEEECLKVMGCRETELNKRAASEFIEHLKGL